MPIFGVILARIFLHSDNNNSEYRHFSCNIVHLDIPLYTSRSLIGDESGFFFYQGFLHRHWRFTGQQGKGGDHLLFHSITSTRSRTLRHLFATLHVRWLSRIFNRNACVYQTATRWDLPPYRITIWVIDWWCNICLFTWWIDTKFLLQRFDIENR